MAKKVLKAIRERVSAKSLVEPGPGKKDVERMVEAAVRAPDHKLLAPWRFIAVEGEARGKLGDAMAELRGGPDAARAAEREKAFRAPLVMVVACEPEESGKVPEVEQLLAVGAACQNLVLAAEALGFGTNWKTRPAAYAPAVKAMLGLSEQATIAGFVQVGTRKSDDTPREAKTKGVLRYL